MQKTVRHEIDRWRQVCLDATLAKVYSASLRLTALDKLHKGHSILSIAVLRIVPRATMCGHDPDHQAAYGKKQDVARQAARHDQAGHEKKAFDQLYRSKVAPALEAAAWTLTSPHAADDGCESGASGGRPMLPGGAFGTWNGPLRARVLLLFWSAVPKMV